MLFVFAVSVFVIVLVTKKIGRSRFERGCSEGETAANQHDARAYGTEDHYTRGCYGEMKPSRVECKELAERVIREIRQAPADLQTQRKLSK